MHIVLYEDYYYNLFFPLIGFHPIFDLYAGFSRIYEKIFQLSKILKHIEGISFIARKNQLNYFLLKNKFENSVYDFSEDVLFINSRLVDIEKLLTLQKNEALVDASNEILAIRADKQIISKITPKALFDHMNDKLILSLCSNVNQADSIKYLFQIISKQDKFFDIDLFLFKNKLHSEFKKINHNLYIHPDAKINKYASIDPGNGIIVIDKDAQINPFTEIRGSSYIGKNSILDRAYVHDFTTIGSNCKISGEIENSIISDYTNKHHTGFFGHSYLGEWVNIGAMTTTSDLKNNYSTIRFNYRSSTVDSNEIKMGSLFGDHVKLAIGLMINCGTIIGECSVLFSNPKSKTIPPATWDETKQYDYHHLIDNIKKVMKRRNIEPDKSYLDLIDELYD